MLDFTTDFGARVAQRLTNELIIWLTTVRNDATPQPSPVWFLWDGAMTVLIYSQPNTPKLRNIAANPTVALNFDGDGRGGNIIVLTGTAHIDTTIPPAHQHNAYLEKHRAAIARIQMTPETFAAAYSIPIRVTLTHLRGH